MRPRLNRNSALIWALVLTGLDYLIAVATSQMAYLTSDDGGIQSVLSGFTTGEPYPFHQFINIVLGAPLAGLYRILPGVQWWYVWSLLAMAAGIFLIHRCLLGAAVKSRGFLPAAVGILAFLDVGFFVYPIANVSFTIVPGILGAGLAVLWFRLAQKEEIRHRGWIFAGTLAGYILLFCHRRATGVVVLCFLLTAFLYFFVSRSGNRRRSILQFFVTAGIFLAVTGCLTAVNTALQGRQNGEAFAEFNSARSRFLDYPHDTYDENPELYEEAGWDRDTYVLVSDWCFLEENVTAESLSYISENSVYTTSATSAGSLLRSIWRDGLCREILLLFAASAVIAGIGLALRFRWKDFLFLLWTNVLAVGLCGYQVLTGRAMYRSIVIVLLPAVAINLLLSFCSASKRRGEREMRRPPARTGILVLLGLICVLPMLTAVFGRDRVEAVAEAKEKLWAVRDYEAAHGENFYVAEVGLTHSIDPARTPDGPSNAIGWGGSDYYSSTYYAQLAANGLTELTGDTFREDRVYLIVSTDALDPDYVDDGNDPFAAFYRYLQRECGAVGFVQDDRITDGAYVYHFIFEEQGEP